MTLCGCGKPKSHGGMCSVRWAVRRANNGPSGIKAKEPAEGAPPMSEEAIARRLFGDLADDILLLRKRGHTVARFRDGFRVDRDVLSADQLRARAAALRERPAKARPAKSKSCGGVDGHAALAVVSPRIATLAAAGVPDRAIAPSGDRPPGGSQASSLAVGFETDPQDLRARVARLERRVEFLFAAVADAVECRRETLVEQAAGLEQLQATLRERH